MNQHDPTDELGGTLASIPASRAPSPAPAPAPAPAGPGDSGGGLVGTVLADRYEVMKKLGEGGMGTVYVGRHRTIGKKSAIKVLSGELAARSDLVQRFLQEAKAASMISQENVVEITDFGDTPDGSVFFVMEYLQGEDLSDTVKQAGPMPWSRVKPIMLQICNALQAAHDAGIVHRDMKPENCFRITRGGNEDFIKVLDFGIAKVTSDEGEGKGLTRTGMIFGTPEYMSPEQAQGSRVDHRVDVYAAGVIMYELMTGRVPFTGENFMAILTQHMFETPKAPSVLAPELQIPPEVENIILKAMQKDREYRFGSMREMGEAIGAVGTGSAAVAVVQESVSRPQTDGQMEFKDGPVQAASAPITHPPTGMSYATMPPQRSLGTLVLGGLFFLASIGLVGYFWMQSQEQQASMLADQQALRENLEATRQAAERAATRSEAAAASVPETAPTAAATPEVARVKVRFRVMDRRGNPVNAAVLDSRDESVLGRTGDAGGVSMTQGSESVTVILRAEGFEDLMKVVIPESDREYTLSMKSLRRGGRARTASARSGSQTGAPDSTGAPTKTAPASPTGGSGTEWGRVDPGPGDESPSAEPAPAPAPKPAPAPAPKPAAEPAPKPAPGPSPGSTIPDLIDEDDVFGDPKAKDKKRPKSCSTGETWNPKTKKCDPFIDRLDY